MTNDIEISICELLIVPDKQVSESYLQMYVFIYIYYTLEY